MSFRERFDRWRTHTADVMRDMSFSQKFSYIVYYYKGWIIGLLIFALFAGYTVDAVVQGHKEIYLQGFFTNDDWGLFDSDTMEEEYCSTLELTKKQTVIFDDALYIDLGGQATEYSAASNGKLIAYMATQELDFVVTTEAVLHHYEADTPMLDFEELLPEDMFEALKPYLYQYTNPRGETKYIGLDMSESRFIKGTYVEGDESVPKYFMFVPYLAPQREHIVDFIRWSFG